MNTATINPATHSRDRFEWTPLRVYAAYRVFLAVLLQILFWVSWPSSLVGQNDPTLFFVTVSSYLALCLIWPLPWKWPPLLSWMASPLMPLLVDITAISLLIHASGGINSNLNVLLVVTTAAGSILLPGPRGYFIAALATFSVMLEQFFFSLRHVSGNPFHLTESALLGLSLFIVSLIIQKISVRLAHSESLALSQQRAIRQLEQLNQQIVERMRTGILVFNNHMDVLVANQAAKTQLGLSDGLQPGSHMHDHPLTREVEAQYRQWLHNPAVYREAINNASGKHAFAVNFALMHTPDEKLVLAFLEDQTRIAQEAQQLKLASLGRLSATIAHEIRNPLSAIHHAADLLEETIHSTEDVRLLEIIQRHVRRVNSIINDILDLSKRPRQNTRQAELHGVLESILQRTSLDYPDLAIGVHYNETVKQIYFDPEQLKQILDNLIRNAALHAGDKAHVDITVDINKDTGTPFIRIQDNGPGISDEVAQHLFEPFFTTSHEGTGLGLYICKELCESNYARLDFEPTQAGACFVITLAHPEKNLH